MASDLEKKKAVYSLPVLISEEFCNLLDQSFTGKK